MKFYFIHFVLHRQEKSEEKQWGNMVLGSDVRPDKVFTNLLDELSQKMNAKKHEIEICQFNIL